MKPKSKIASFFNALFIEHRSWSPVAKIERVVGKMRTTEKIIFMLSSLICVVTGIAIITRVHSSFLVEVPAVGGSFTEGVVGSPRFINPVLDISDTDKDLASLVYSGLMRSTKDGMLEPDLAETYEVSPDGLTYTFKIKENARFHDGQEVTADDVIFTVNKILDPVIKSPRASGWEGVTVEKMGEKEVSFTLRKPYSPFLSVLTLGILPEHIWKPISAEEFPFSQYNLEPIGSGPYKVSKISKNSGGIPTSMTLSSWSRYVSERAKVKTITFRFFQNENELVSAYKSGTVDSASGLSPSAAKEIAAEGQAVDVALLPRIFGVFFNQNAAPVFLNKEVRQALDMAAPKQRIVDEVLAGYGEPLNGPTPQDIQTEGAQGNIEAAKELLTKNGWKENSSGILEKKAKSGTVALRFSISTTDAPELKAAAEILQEAWRQLGAEVEVKVFEAGDLSQNVIKPRKYDALLFGEVVTGEGDLYPFWHSSERNDPGLNIALYANITADKALSDMQTASIYDMADKRDEAAAEIKKDIPAVFLFSPDFLYAPAPSVKNVSLKPISYPSERFLAVDKWYIETNRVLSVFQPSE